MPIGDFRVVCSVNPVLGPEETSPPFQLHVLDLEADVAYVGVIAPTVSCGLSKVKALTDFLNEFMESNPERSLEFDKDKGVYIWTRR